MVRWSSLVSLLAVLLLLACPGRPSSEGDGSGAGTETAVDSTATDPSADGPTSAGPTADATEGTSTATTATTDDPSTSTGESECVQGTFMGRYYSGFEWTYVEICDGPRAWMEVGNLFGCDATWVVVEGSLCGPGSYGHLGSYDYQLGGTVVEGPCVEGSCGGEPSGCGTVEEVCGGMAECDWIAQDCPEGERCVPSSRSGVPPWEATRCVPIPGTTVGLGEACQTGLGNDACELGLFCWSSDPLAPDGTCVELCDPAASCVGPGTCIDCEGQVGPAIGPELGMCLPADCGGMPCGC